MKKLLFLFVALVATTTLWASNTITYTATEKLPETTDEWSGGLHTNAFNVAITSHEFSNGTGTITFAGEVTTIGNRAFLNCYDLISVTIPNSVTKIGDAAFSWNSNLTLITIPSSVTTIGEDAFGSCSGLTSINVDAANTHFCSVDGVLFNYAKDTLIHYPMGNTRTEYVVPNSVTTIGKSAFYDCSRLTSVTIPNSVTTIGHNAFFNILNIVYNGTATGSPWGAKCVNGYVDGYLVYSDASKTMLCGCFATAMGEITIPNSVTTIGDKAFSGCSSLTSVTIPNSVTTIGTRAFYGSGVKNVEVAWTSEEQLPSMGWGAFESIANWAGPSVATLHVPEGTKSIYENADQWKDFGMITDGAIPDSNTITYTATEKLTNPYLMIGWTTFGPAIISHTFSNGTGTITCEGEITKIGEMAFSDCKSLTSIAIPNSVTTIEDYAFQSCSSLTSIAIGKSITTIGERAFLRCDALISIDVDAANTHYCSVDGVLFNYAKDTLILYPAANTRTEYTIPNSVTTLGYSAFRECSSLTSVTIPNSVTTIGECAFYYATSLTSVIVNWTDVNELPIMGDVVFMGIANLEGPAAATLHVPEGTKSIYKNADQWKDFGTITDSQVDEGNEVDMKPFITYQDQTGTFDYPYYPSWSDNSGQLRIFRDNGLQDLNLEAGVSKIIFHKTASTIGQIWIGDPNWNQLATVADWEGGLTTLEYVLDEAAIKCITDETSDGWSETAFILMGDGLEVTKIAIVPGTDQTPVVGKQFVDAISGLKFKITAVGEVNNVKVISNNGVDPTYSGDVVIPSTVNYHDTTFTVTQIGSNAFAGCSNLTSVTIPNSVTTIGTRAFYVCPRLTSVAIPNSVTTIEEEAFIQVNNIEYNGTATGSPWGAKCVNGYVDGYLVYSDASKTMLCGCFATAMGEITIPNSVTTIGEEAFARCSGLTSITIPSSVTTVGELAFLWCDGLTSPIYSTNWFAYLPTSYQGAYTIPDGIKQIVGGAFYWCEGLTSVTIPNSVTTLGKEAFSGCSKLTLITIPNSVTTIGEWAFLGSGLKDVSVAWTSDEQLPSMGWGVFEGIANWDGPSVATLHVPEGTKSIYKNADQWKDFGTITDKQYDPKNYIITYTATEQLTNLYLEVGWATFGPAIISHTFSNGTGTITCDGEITKIGDMAFAFSGLTSINIPNSVTTIERMAFYNCANLTSITIPTSVTTIGEGAFEYCYGLTSVTIPNSVTTIGEWAFEYCYGLTSVTIPNSVTTIGEGTFASCTGLTSVTIPNSVTTIGERAFAFCSGLTKTNYTGTIADWCKIEFENYSSNPIYYSHNFFINDEEVKALIIPEGVDTIGEAAFYECSGLTSVTIGNSVTTIGDNAFYHCSGLTSVTIPNSVTTIGDYAFSGCTGLTSVTIPNAVTTIGYAAFADCSGLTSINVDAANTHYCSVDGVLFNYAKDTIIQYPANNSKTTYTIPNSVTTIGFAAFAYCSGLTSVTIPNSVTTIGFAAFAYCSGLTSITIPSSVTTIGESAFDNCTSLTSITIPNSVTTIGDDAFYLVNNIVYNGTATGSPWGAKCVNGYVDGYLVYTDASKTILCGCSSAAIGEIFIPNSVTTIGESAFEGCSGLTSISIPNSVTTIGEWAFADCSGLTSVTIPNSVTTIGDYAFAGCSGLTSITIPNSVTTIGDYAFYWCEVLASITCYAVNPPTCGDAAFDGISQDAKVYVLASSLSAYQSADVWKDLNLLPLGADETPIDGDEPIVTPTDDAVTITWGVTDGADTYTLTITKDGETVCVLTFNADGQLTNIAFAAPGHNGARQAPAATRTTQGFQFTVTGLDPGTAYEYSVTTTNAEGQTLAEHKGNFSTTGGGTPTPINEVHGSQSTTLKYFHNGNLIIERNGIKYTPAGQKVR